jgi:hypothetical protein
MSFNTQFTNGLRIQILKKQSQNPCSSLYFMGVGAENIDKEKEVFYVSPFTLKTTLVLDQQLADQGAFGVLSYV